MAFDQCMSDDLPFEQPASVHVRIVGWIVQCLPISNTRIRFMANLKRCSVLFKGERIVL